MTKILVAYATMAGATADVARAVGEELARSGAQVDVLAVEAIHSLDGYDAVVVGGPMIMGWHRSAMGFVKKHRAALRRVPFAVFVTAMSLTQTGQTRVDDVAVFVDENLPKAPEHAGRLTLR